MDCMLIMNQMGSLGSSAAAQRRRMALGVVILLLVDVIWVASSELTSYIFRRQEYNKPFFSTFVKTSMLVLYLLGFLLWRPWRRQCTGSLKRRHASRFGDTEAYFAPCANDTTVNDGLSEPLYVPVKFPDAPAELSNGSMETNRQSAACKKQRVRFSDMTEVRRLPSTQAVEAKLSRMSYPAAKDHEAALRAATKLSVRDVAKLSFFFCFVWFLANLSYQEALSDTQVAIVNILSSTSGLFTLILAAVFPSSSSDRFTLSKLLAVALSVGGVVLVSLSALERPDDKGAAGSLWSLAGALFYAVYVVMIKRWADGEEKLDIPMFLGFVGLFNLLLLWPGFLLMHYAGLEAFEIPGRLVWTYILLNGLIGTVLSEFLWLWCGLRRSGLLPDFVAHRDPGPQPHRAALHHGRYLHAEGALLLAVLGRGGARLPLLLHGHALVPLQQLGPGDGGLEETPRLCFSSTSCSQAPRGPRAVRKPSPFARRLHEPKKLVLVICCMKKLLGVRPAAAETMEPARASIFNASVWRWQRLLTF